MTEPIVEVVPAGELRERVSQLGAEIAADYAGMEPILVGVLKGCVPFLADLSRQLPGEVGIDFLSLSRFGRAGRVRINMDVSTPLTGRHVIIVEDIVDTGLTLTSIHRMIEAREPASIATVTLIDKAARRIVDVPLRYRGFEVGDEFLIGYGLDWDGVFRNLPSLWAVLDLPLLKDDPGALVARVFGTVGDRLAP
jgi:hypoxanthine phosphoribosyltransferase